MICCPGSTQRVDDPLDRIVAERAPGLRARRSLRTRGHMGSPDNGAAQAPRPRHYSDFERHVTTLAALRDQIGWSRPQLAERIGYSEARVRQWER